MIPCFYDKGYYLGLPRTHPFPMDKFPRARVQLARMGLDPASLKPAEPAPLDALLRVHDEDYLDRVAGHGLTRYDRNRLGLPALDGLLPRSRLETGGTLAAARHVLATRGTACNLAGGTHHAFPDRGLGYCVLNDVAVAIRDLQAREPGLHCFIADTDAHQGNGSHHIFARDDSVFTYSIHVGDNYPSAKVAGDLDVPLPRFVGDAEYLARLEETLPAALQSFEPDIVFWIAGADCHRDDRFGQMNLSDEGMRRRDERVLDAVARIDAGLVVLYGGGYNRDRRYTARLHANTVMTVVGSR